MTICAYANTYLSLSVATQCLVPTVSSTVLPSRELSLDLFALCCVIIFDFDLKYQVSRCNYWNNKIETKLYFYVM